MIQFQMFDHQPERCEKYHQMLTDNLPVLEGIGSEADFEKYGDSLGWFDIDTWANEAELSAIEELAARVRRDADVFVLCIKLTHQAHGDLLFLLIQHLFKNTGGYGWFEVKTVTASFHLG